MQICHYSQISTCLIVLAVLGIRSPTFADSSGWTITQLTNNAYEDRRSQVCGSNVVWEGQVGNQNEIFLYDGVRTIQLTDNDYSDVSPRISGSNVVWEGRMRTPGSYEIFMYDGATIMRITSDSYTDIQPRISGTNIVWNSVREGNWEIFLYDGTATTRVTNNDYDDWRPRVSGSTIVWQLYDGNDWEIFTYDIDTATTTQVTDSSYWDHNPQISGSNVVWEGYDGKDYEIFLYDGTTVTQLTDNNALDCDVQVSGTNVVWQSWDIYDKALFLYNGITTIQLTHSQSTREIYESLAVSGSNVAWMWLRSGGDDSEIFLYDGSNIIQLTDNSYNDMFPQISGSTIVWNGYDGGDWDIFMARPLPEPAIEAEIDIAPKTLNLQSKGKWITCYIWLPEDYNVVDINSDSVLLGDEIEPQWLWIDEDNQVAMAKFSRSDVQDILESGEVELTVSGEFVDGNKFEGSDTIRVINKPATENHKPEP